MTILNLHMFIEIVKDMNLCVTAQRLFTTQQGLSGHIKRLENHFGVSLFERNPRLVLTAEGRALLQEAKNILESEQHLFSVFGTSSSYNFGNIKVSCGMARSRYCMPKIISDFSSLYPSVSVNLFDENHLRDSDIFAEDKIDIAIGRAVQSSHSIKEMPLIDLHGYIMVSDVLLRKNLKDETDNFVKKALMGIEVNEIPSDIPMAYAGSNKKEPWICEKIPELRNRPRVAVERENYDILVGLCREGKMMIIISEMYLHYIKNTFSPKFYENIYFFPHFQNGKRFIEHEVLSYDSSKYHPQYFEEFSSIVQRVFKDIKKDFETSENSSAQPLTTIML